MWIYTLPRDIRNKQKQTNVFCTFFFCDTEYKDEDSYCLKSLLSLSIFPPFFLFFFLFTQDGAHKALLSLARDMGKEEEESYRQKALFEHSNPSEQSEPVVAKDIKRYFNTLLLPTLL